MFNDHVVLQPGAVVALGPFQRVSAAVQGRARVSATPDVAPQTPMQRERAIGPSTSTGAKNHPLAPHFRSCDSLKHRHDRLAGLSVPTSLQDWLLPDENVDINNCDQEPIHIPGSIQPHGYLLAFDNSGALRFESENVARLDPTVVEFVRKYAKSNWEHTTPSRWGVKRIDLEGQPTDLILHRIDGLCVCEIEPGPGPNVDYPFQPIIDAAEQLTEATSVNEALQVAVQIIHRVNGFGRVMAYVFDVAGHGSVMAETVAGDFGSFLGLRFPATDIPKQARKLYSLQYSRLIRDVDAPTVPLRQSASDSAGKQPRPLNMAFCHLRSVSPIHIEYLKNMGVAASCSFSLLIDGELVGLIACHHPEPRFIDFNTRSTCEAIARQASYHLERLSAERQRDEKAQRLSAQVELLAELSHGDGLSADAVAWSKIADFVDADAFLVSIADERAVPKGDNTAISKEVWHAASVMARQTPEECTSDVELTRINAGAEGGVLVVPVAEDNWVAWYRRPIVREVAWAGKPESDDDAKSLTPRASFEEWREIIKGRAAAWTRPEIELADILRRGLVVRFFGVVGSNHDSFSRVLKHLREYVSVLEASNLALKTSNDDLEQLTYAASHDFKGPLRTIRTFLPILKEDLGEIRPPVDRWLDFIGNAAESLHRVQEGLLTLSRTNQATTFGPVDLSVLLASVQQSLAADLAGVVVNVDELPTVHGDAQQLATVFSNLLRNAVKYRSSDRALRIDVSARTRSTHALITVADNGLGFPDEAKEKIFELFTRLHANQSDGDGLGLALCRRIVRHHGGWIRASGEPGHGATFEVSLRKEAQVESHEQQ